MNDETVVQLTNSPFLHYIIISINFYPELAGTIRVINVYTYMYSVIGTLTDIPIGYTVIAHTHIHTHTQTHTHIYKHIPGRKPGQHH